MSKIAKKLSVYKLRVFAELHAKDQSKMNHRWSFHDTYWFKEDMAVVYLVEQFLKTKIKTKNYDCYEQNDMKQKTCMDDFYMKKLNCTFPWIKPNDESRQKCGSQHYINDLIDLIDDVVKGNNLSQDVKKCLIPNCVTTEWKIIRRETFNDNGTGLEFAFDSGKKVCIFLYEK